MVKRCGVELHELHVLHSALGTIDHGDAVAGSHQRVCRGVIHHADAARRHECHARQESVHHAGFLVEDIGTIALNTRCAPCHNFSQVVLRENFHRKMVLIHIDLRMSLDGLDERHLDFVTRVVGMMQDAELAVSTLAVQVILTLLVLVEVYAPVHEFPNLSGSLGNDLLHRIGVAEPVTGNHRVVDVLVKVIHLQVGHCSHTALREVGVRLFHLGLAHESHSPCLCHLEGKTHTGHTRADDEIIIFAYHSSLSFLLLKPNT